VISRLDPARTAVPWNRHSEYHPGHVSSDFPPRPRQILRSRRRGCRRIERFAKLSRKTGTGFPLGAAKKYPPTADFCFFQRARSISRSSPLTIRASRSSPEQEVIARADGRSSNGSCPHCQPHRRSIGRAASRLIYSWQESSLRLCGLGTSFTCNRRAGLTPSCSILRNAAAPGRFDAMVTRNRTQRIPPWGNVVS
jgi:hypothetical protein